MLEAASLWLEQVDEVSASQGVGIGIVTRYMGDLVARDGTNVFPALKRALRASGHYRSCRMLSDVCSRVRSVDGRKDL